MTISRTDAMTRWLNSLGRGVPQITLVSGDASFRRYFRATFADQHFVVMDAPPEKEDTRPFIHVADAFHQLGINVPQIVERDVEQGFLMLEDQGDVQYAHKLNSDSVDALYHDAFDCLIKLQTSPAAAQIELPDYDHSLLMREMNLFDEWFLQRHLQVQLSDEERSTLNEALEKLAAMALSQPQVCVHRDFHSRNLMLVEQDNPGVLDFQDAVRGPVTYDLVSLLRDCYVAWPKERVLGWVEEYRQKLNASGRFELPDAEGFKLWFDWMGLQRHIKVLGIFARLNYRDNKPAYLADLPLTLQYVLDVLTEYAELSTLAALFEQYVVPRLDMQSGACK